VGVSRDCPFFWYPLLSQERANPRNGQSYGFQIWPVGYIHRVHPNKSPLKFWRKGSVGVFRDCPIFLGTPVISGTGKATNFKFCTHIYRLNRNKSPLKISGKVAVGVIRDSRKFSGHPYIGRIAIAQLSCWLIHLCDSQTDEQAI